LGFLIIEEKAAQLGKRGEQSVSLTYFMIPRIENSSSFGVIGTNDAGDRPLGPRRYRFRVLPGGGWANLGGLTIFISVGQLSYWVGCNHFGGGPGMVGHLRLLELRK
jgi:hypothetical protein